MASTANVDSVLDIRRQMAAAICKHLADAATLPQRELAAELGMTQARLNALLRGKVEHISADALITLALNLGLNVRVGITRPYVR